MAAVVAEGGAMTRYASGEEPMVGDFVRYAEERTERSVAQVGAGYVRMSNDETWPTCKLTLIHRPYLAETVTEYVFKEGDCVELGGARYTAEQPEHCRLSDTCDLPRNHGPACRVLLGHDRNGREVRRGDMVRCFDNPSFELSAFSFAPDTPFECAVFHSISGHKHILQKAAELVDGKPPHPGPPPGSDVRVNMGGLPFEQWRRVDAAQKITAQWLYECDWPDSGSVPISVLRAVEQACRALAGPTLAERYVATEVRVLLILAEEGVMEPCPIIDYRHANDGRPAGFIIEVPSIGAEFVKVDGTSDARWGLFREVVRECLRELGREALKKR
jgi:hypothetical protein